MIAEAVKVLLVEDDEDDYVLTRDVIADMPGSRVELDWARTFQEGLELMCSNRHDICLVDYRLGAQTGIELLRAALKGGCQAPVILLTGMGQHAVDMNAMEAGAADYLVKAQLRSDSLERSIRYALQRKRAAMIAAFEQARLAAFGEEVGLALTRRDSLEAILGRCAQAMVKHLGAARAEISTFDRDKAAFQVRAVVLPSAASNGAPSSRAPLRLEPAALMSGQPVLIQPLAQDARLTDPGWAEQERFFSYAGFPLMLEEQLVGLVSLFAQHPLTEQIHQEMSSVAHGIALCIDRKRSEEALGLSEDKYRSVVENLKEVVFQLDQFGHWTFLNPAWTAVAGFSTQAALGTFFLEYIYREDQEQNRHIFLKLIEGSLEYCRYETRLLTASGKVRWVEVYVQPTQNRGETILGVSGTLIDITERKLAEMQIQKLAAFPQVNPNPVLEFGPDATLSYVNDAGREMVKSFGQEELVAILPPAFETIVRECLADNKKRLRLEVVLQGRTVSWSFFPIASSQVVHCYGVEVTEMLNLETQLRHAQKLESVGQLAAGVAHDFNNILTVILGYAECLLMEHQGNPATTRALKEIVLSSQRAATLTRQLLTFSRKQPLQRQVLDLNGVLQNLGNMLARLLREDIRLDYRFEPGLPAIEADAGMVEQIAVNLAVNARDAMPNGGQLLIATSTIEIDRQYVSSHPDASIGHCVCLTVTDNGCGMDNATLARLFEPFFSTKDVGKGSGLGLATVYGIVKEHGGWIEVASEIGQGSTFRIYLPALPNAVLPAAAPQDPAASEKIVGGRERILLVEDDPTLRCLAYEVLNHYGYEMAEAGSGVDALRVWDQHGGRFDLLLTDLVMPEGMSGTELALQLKRRKPALKVIYTSGYSPEMLDSALAQSGDSFLPKPYLPPQLAKLVRQCLDADTRSLPAARPRSGAGNLSLIEA